MLCSPDSHAAQREYQAIIDTEDKEPEYMKCPKSLKKNIKNLDTHQDY